MEIILLSLPIFYIIGALTFIRWLIRAGKSSNTKRIEFLESTITELTQSVKKSPNKKVSALLLEYVKELEDIKKIKIPLVEATPEGQVAPTPQLPPGEEEARIIEEKPAKQTS